jgi:putative hydrolase of HD superfamily
MPLLDLFFEAGNLKKLKRTGWLLRGVPVPESIADHSFRTALITMLLGDKLRKEGVEIDVERAVKIALIHDLGEARITDIPLPAQRYFDKVEGERRAISEMLGENGLGEYAQLFDEYENESTLEGRLVRFTDRLEMLIQAIEYEESGFKNLDEFWEALDGLRGSEFYPYFKDIVEGLERRRKGKD